MKQATNGGIRMAGDALSGELWEVKKERIRNASIHGKLPGWDLRSVSSAFMNFHSIVKLFCHLMKEVD